MFSSSIHNVDVESIRPVINIFDRFVSIDIECLDENGISVEFQMFLKGRDLHDLTVSARATFPTAEVRDHRQ